MDGSPASLAGLADFLLQQGVTSALATTMTDTPERIEAALAAYADRGGAPFRGLHIEGPYLNAAYRGSQPARHLRQPQPEEYMPWLETGLVKLMTIAPEIPAGERLLRDALSHGAAVSIGHSGASYEAATRYFALAPARSRIRLMAWPVSTIGNRACSSPRLKTRMSPSNSFPMAFMCIRPW